MVVTDKYLEKSPTLRKNIRSALAGNLNHDKVMDEQVLLELNKQDHKDVRAAREWWRRTKDTYDSKKILELVERAEENAPVSQGYGDDLYYGNPGGSGGQYGHAMGGQAPAPGSIVAYSSIGNGNTAMANQMGGLTFGGHGYGTGYGHDNPGASGSQYGLGAMSRPAPAPGSLVTYSSIGNGNTAMTNQMGVQIGYQQALPQLQHQQAFAYGTANPGGFDFHQGASSQDLLRPIPAGSVAYQHHQLAHQGQDTVGHQGMLQSFPGQHPVQHQQQHLLTQPPNDTNQYQFLNQQQAANHQMMNNQNKLLERVLDRTFDAQEEARKAATEDKKAEREAQARRDNEQAKMHEKLVDALTGSQQSANLAASRNGSQGDGEVVRELKEMRDDLKLLGAVAGKQGDTNEMSSADLFDKVKAVKGDELAADASPDQFPRIAFFSSVTDVFGLIVNTLKGADWSLSKDLVLAISNKDQPIAFIKFGTLENATLDFHESFEQDVALPVYGFNTHVVIRVSKVSKYEEDGKKEFHLILMMPGRPKSLRPEEEISSGPFDDSSCSDIVSDEDDDIHTHSTNENNWILDQGVLFQVLDPLLHLIFEQAGDLKVVEVSIDGDHSRPGSHEGLTAEGAIVLPATLEDALSVYPSNSPELTLCLEHIDLQPGQARVLGKVTPSNVTLKFDKCSMPHHVSGRNILFKAMDKRSSPLKLVFHRMHPKDEGTLEGATDTLTALAMKGKLCSLEMGHHLYQKKAEYMMWFKPMQEAMQDLECELIIGEDFGYVDREVGAVHL